MPRAEAEGENTNLWNFVGHLVEVRTNGGGCYRGVMACLDNHFVYLRRQAGGLALIANGAIVAVLDEERSFATVPAAAQPETGEEP